MKQKKWRKGTKKDAKESVIALLIFAMIFLCIGFLILRNFINLIPIIFCLIGFVFIVIAFKFFLKYVINEELYEYYIHDKFIPSHYKGSQIGLPNKFSDLTDYQDKCLEQGIFPPCDLLNDTVDEYSILTKIDKINNNSDKNLKSSLILKVILIIFFLITSLQFIIPVLFFITNILQQQENIDIKYLSFFIVIVGFILFGIIFSIYVFIKIFIKKSQVEPPKKDKMKIDEMYDEDDPFASYYKKNQK